MGPQSVGYRLTQDALVFGGRTITASDVAVAKGLTTMGQPKKITDQKLPSDLVNDAINKIHTMLEDVIDRVKVSEPVSHNISKMICNCLMFQPAVRNRVNSQIFSG